jgi:O-antigen/teichoic acid export membrane protein
MTARQGSAVLSQGVVSLLAYGVNFAASFVAIVGMIRIMGKEPYGIFALAIQITAFTSMLADFGIGPIIMRRLAIAPQRAAAIVLEASTVRLLLMLPAWLLTLGIGWILEPGWTFFLMLNLMLCNMIVSSKMPVLRGTIEALYRSQTRMSVPTIAMAVDSIVLLAMVLFLPAYFRDPVQAMLWYTISNVIGAVALAVGGWSLTRRISTEPAHISWSSMKELLWSASPLALFLVLNALHVSIETVYLKIFHGDSEVGVFNAALRFMAPLAVFPTIIAISASPYFARASAEAGPGQEDALTRLFSQAVKTLLIGSVLLAGLGATNARELIGAPLKYAFEEAAVPLIILFIVFLPMSLNMFLVEVNNARGNIVTNSKAAALLATISVLAGIPLVLYFASVGAALNKLAATSLGLVFLLMRSREGIRLSLIPLVVKIALLLALLVSLRLLLADFGVILSNALALSVVIVAIFALKVFSTEELRQWKEQISSVFVRNI